jgi:hypothetical protein
MSDRPAGRVSLLEVHQTGRRAIELEIRVTMPATVVEWRKAETTKDGTFPPMVVVELDHAAVRLGHKDDALPDEVYRALAERLDGRGELTGPYPPMTLPIAYPGGKQGRFRGPLEKGDEGMVAWTDRAMSRILVASLAGKPLDPGDDWTHGENMNDAVFEPGFLSGARINMAQVDAVFPDDRWLVGPDDRSCEMSWTVADRIMRLITTGQTITVDAAAEVLLGTALELAVRFDSLKESLVGAFTAGAGAVAPMDGGLAAFNAAKIALQNTIDAASSDKVKV